MSDVKRGKQFKTKLRNADRKKQLRVWHKKSFEQKKINMEQVASTMKKYILENQGGCLKFSS